MMALAEILIPIAAFAMIVLITFFIVRYNYQTKKLIIEHGGNFDIPKRRFPFLEFALTLVGIGIGLGLSVIPKAMEVANEITDLLTGALVLIFGGLGLITALILRKKLEKNQ